jgi:hypothetical protein
MSQGVTVAMVDHLEMLLEKNFTSKRQLTIGEREENAIPLRYLQQVEKFVAGWKSQGLPREWMISCFSNPLVREAVNGGLLLELAEVDLLQDEWMKILRRHEQIQELIVCCNDSSGRVD